MIGRMFLFFFFFQAEDGIRDLTVTGVQTCALPISFEIALPAGYEVDDLPPPVNADYSFASYHSKTEVNGNTLKYTRTFEVKELSVPLSKVEDLKKLYRIIASDERNTAVLKPATH